MVDSNFIRYVVHVDESILEIGIFYILYSDWSVLFTFWLQGVRGNILFVFKFRWKTKTPTTSVYLYIANTLIYVLYCTPDRPTDL